MTRMILVRIGSVFGLTADINTVLIFEAASFEFRTHEGADPVTIRDLSDTLPTGEWTFVDNGDGTATLSTASAVTRGEFTITIQAQDGNRNLIKRTFNIVVFDPFYCPDYEPPAGPTSVEGGLDEEADAIDPLSVQGKLCREII